MKIMKTFIIFLILLLTFTVLTEGKLITGYGFKTGLVRGTQIPKNFPGYWDQTDILSFKWRTGFGAIGYLEWFSTHPLSVITEIGYIRKGVREELMEFTSEQSIRINPLERDDHVDYIVLSFLMKLTFYDAPKYYTKYISPYLLIGPRFDIRLSYLLPGSVTFWGADIYRYEPIDFGGNLGIGIEFKFFKKFPVIFLEGQYNYTFTESIKTIDSYWGNSEFDRKNKAYQIFLGVKLK